MLREHDGMLVASVCHALNLLKFLHLFIQVSRIIMPLCMLITKAPLVYQLKDVLNLKEDPTSEDYPESCNG